MRPAKSARFGPILTIAAICLITLPAFAADRLLSASKAWLMAKGGEITIVDVRSRAEWRRTGVPEGARKVTIHNQEGEKGFIREMTRALDGDRGRPIALICARGNRSKRAFNILEKAGFTQVYNVGEGMLGRGYAKGWIQSGLPIERCAQC